jgi:cytoplasmic iron level regulating protein YaaA (DUF328/UPF0246 family)
VDDVLLRPLGLLPGPLGDQPEAPDMIALLSPAKRLDFKTPHTVVDTTLPALLEESGMLMKTTRNLSQKKLRELMDISLDLAKLNSDRFQELTTELTPDNSRPAILSFSGATYLGLGAKTMNADDLAFAQDHVMILSGLYGLLRAKDLMQPYRLEMGSKIKTRRGANLYAFWGDRIRLELQGRLGDEPILVNLASNEYFKSVQVNKLKARIITPVFKETKNGTTRTLFMFAKQARGLMARYMVDHRVFERPQPAPTR